MRRFSLQLRRAPRLVPHVHTCPECRRDWVCVDMWCNGLLQFKQHPQNCWRSDLQSMIGHMFTGLPVNASLSDQFRSWTRREPTTPPVWVRPVQLEDLHGVTLELDDQARMQKRHPELQEVRFENGRWIARDSNGTVTQSRNGTQWTGAYGRKHNPPSWPSVMLNGREVPIMGLSTGGIAGGRPDYIVADDVLDADPIAQAMLQRRVQATPPRHGKTFTMNATMEADEAWGEAFKRMVLGRHG